MNAAEGLRKLLEADADRAKLTRVERAQIRAALAALESPKPRALPVYTLAEVRNGTGWPRGQRFAALPEGVTIAHAAGGEA